MTARADASIRGPRADETRAAAVVRERWLEDDPTVLDLVRLVVRAGSLGHAGIDLDLPDERLAALLDLAEDERLPADRAGRLAALARSSAVAVGPLQAEVASGAPVRPLVLTGTLLQSERSHRFEQRIVSALRRRRGWPGQGVHRDLPARALELLDRLDAVLDGPEPPEPPTGFWISAEQRRAVRRLLGADGAGRLAILRGGPGTGKTTTVATLLGVLGAAATATPRIALAAPTGRARSRLVESIRGQGGALAATLGLVVDPELAGTVRDDVLAVRAHTVHGLLGIGRDGVARRSDGSLPYDVIVVDETSMMDLPLAADLLDAASDDAFVVLVGDPDQLESVGTGSVLHSLIEGLLAADPDAPVGTLATNQRVASASTPEGRREAERRDRVVAAIRRREPEALLSALEEEAATMPAAIAWCRVEDGEDPAQRSRVVMDEVREPLLRARRLVSAAGAAPDPEVLDAALASVAEVRLLCAHRSGRWGVTAWNGVVRASLDEGSGDADAPSGSRPGEPVIMTVNDPLTRLSNGDVGIVAGVAPTTYAFPRPPDPEAGRGIDGTGAAGSSGILVQRAVALPEVRSANAITVHRAQGSEYDVVVVIMPPSVSRLATRELLYTAVTRARRRVLLVASPEALRTAVLRSSVRMGGLERAVASLVGDPGPEDGAIASALDAG